MSKKKRTPIDDILNNLEHIMERMLEDLDIDPEHFKPTIYGFSITQNGEREPEIREFSFPLDNNMMEFNEPEPYIDIVESDTHLHVLMEIPDVHRDDIQIRCSSTNIQLTIKNEHRDSTHNLKLPAQVEPKTSRATYKNGVLEITLRKKENTAQDIPVE